MKGIQHIEVSNRKAKYTFDLVRNITIVRGFSGTGKTTLYNMIRDFSNNGIASGVKINSTKKCVVLYDRNLWQVQLQDIKDSVVFIDEGADFAFLQEFASAIKNTDDYYVIFSRESLHYLPYSVNEIYEIKTKGKNHTFDKIYKSKTKHIYTNVGSGQKNNFDKLLTEDVAAGFEFFCAYYANSNVACESAEGKSNVFKKLKELIAQKIEGKILVVADGAAFGNEMNRVMQLCKEQPFSIDVCLPESFEWLVLKSGILRQKDIESILENPSDFIESKDHFTWERFFTALLIERTKGNKYMRYDKSNLPDFYKEKGNAEKIIKEIPYISKSWSQK